MALRRILLDTNLKLILVCVFKRPLLEVMTLLLLSIIADLNCFVFVFRTVHILALS